MGSLGCEVNAEDVPWEPQPYHPPPRPERTASKRKADDEHAAEQERRARKDELATQSRHSVKFRRDSMLQAQQLVHDWHEYHGEELDRYQNGRDAVSTVSTRFDLMMFQRQHQATRELFQKEKAWEDAREDAAIAGVDLQDNDQESVSPDYEYDDDLREAEDQACIASIIRIRIISWMEDRDIQRDFDLEEDVGDYKSVRVGDGGSVVAYDRDRKRIDKWEERRRKFLEEANPRKSVVGSLDASENAVWKGNRVDRCGMPLS